MMLTRPPVVFVHGINSGPTVWEGSGKMAGALQSQGYIIEGDSFVNHSISDFGMGPLTTDWLYVRQATEQTLKDFRQGGVGYSTDGSFLNPDSGLSVPTGLAEGTLIAVQKVDVVAHSYGGLLTRWYMEQAADSSGTPGSEFQDYRNVRTMIELGTPNLGSPLANLVDEAYQNSPLGKTIANAAVSVVGQPLPFSEHNIIGVLNYLGQLPTSYNGVNPLPFYEDDAVDSPLLQQLNGGNPFNASASYAAVAGTDVNYSGTLAHVIPYQLDLYRDVQPLGPNGQSYFPWLQTLDGANNDSIVPTWSAMLPDLTYDKTVNTDHIHIESNTATEADVLAFLANPNLPLGSAQRTAAGSNGWQPPVGDRNAYSNSAGNVLQSGTNSGPSMEVSGAGLNPAAIVGVRLDGTDYNGATWDAYKNAGAQYPVFTGMVQVSQLNSGVNFSFAAGYSGISTESSPYSLGNFYLYGQGVSSSPNYISVSSQYLQGAGPNDWVPFSIATLAMGRGVDHSVSSPYVSQPFEIGQGGPSSPQFVSISYSLNSMTSAATTLNLPVYAPPTPVISSDNPTGTISVNLNGAFQVASGGAATTYDVQLWGTTGTPQSGPNTLLYDSGLIQADLTPYVYWAGLALPYGAQVNLSHNSNGLIVGPNGNTIASGTYLFQYFNESGFNTPDSSTTEAQ